MRRTGRDQCAVTSPRRDCRAVHSQLAFAMAMTTTNTETSEPAKKKWQSRPALSWKDLPGFCDASASLSAATFGARRLPEIKSLWTQACLQQQGDETLDAAPEDFLKSGGGKTSSRHLRRRATSHKSRKRHRYPTTNDALPSSKASSEEMTAESRRKRRKKHSILYAKHESWHDKRAWEMNVPDSSESASNIVDAASAYWIPTHIWHAKRFRMEMLWGWKVPLMHSNRGARAALRLAREGKTLVQDVTWCSQPIIVQLELGNEGSEQIRLNSLSLLIQRIIPSFAPQMDTVVEGMVHGCDCFPREAIGPVRWLVARHLLAAAAHPANKVSKSIIFVHLLLHPSIQNVVIDLLRELFHNIDYATLSSLGGGVACLRLRGLGVMRTLRKSVSQAVSRDVFNDKIFETATGSKVPEHFYKGQTLRYEVKLNNAPDNYRDTTTIQLTIVSNGNSPQAPEKSGCKTSRISSLDIFCDPCVAKPLFLDLVMQGGACPIGMVEESLLLLESDPPLPIFPREFPDTREGRVYWSSCESNDWEMVRWHLEGGVGRIPNAPKRSLIAIASEQLLVDKDEIANDLQERSYVVMVRGSFGRPFIDALALASNPAFGTKSSSTSRRRPHRPHNPQRFGAAPLISLTSAEKHNATCKALSASLTLPAVLLCQFEIIGKGVVQPGAILLSGSILRNPIGFVTSSSFSPSRGCFHGLAVCGAARFLEALAHAHQDRSIVIDRRQEGSRLLCLKVTVGSLDRARVEAAISLAL